MSDRILAAKAALDHVIRISRIHFYKPIQIAEILHRKRTGLATLDLLDLDAYRAPSRRWRDDISRRLVGNVSTSSMKYQDDVFSPEAMPPIHLAALAEENERANGIVESYIYHQMAARWGDLQTAADYVLGRTAADFALGDFLGLFDRRAGLKRSVDKAYEIVVYALFATLAYAFEARVEVSLTSPNAEMLEDFAGFVRDVLGIRHQGQGATAQAQFHRVGVANAADRGLDIMTNFGPAIQIKHLSLDIGLAKEIADGIQASNIVIVCKSADAAVIKAVLAQIDFRVNAIVTQDDLESWYGLALAKYPDTLGAPLIRNLQAEFAVEFPHTAEIAAFLAERGYASADLRDLWAL